VYNVGGVSRTTIADLARSIGELTGAPVVFPETEAALTGAPGEVSLSLARLRQDFGKTDFIGLQAGLGQTIQWLRMLKAAEGEGK